MKIEDQLLTVRTCCRTPVWQRPDSVRRNTPGMLHSERMRASRVPYATSTLGAPASACPPFRLGWVPSGRQNDTRPRINRIPLAWSSTAFWNHRVSWRPNRRAVPLPCSANLPTHLAACFPYAGLSHTRPTHAAVRPSSGRVIIRLAVGQGLGSGAAHGSRSNAPSASRIQRGVSHTWVCATPPFVPV